MENPVEYDIHNPFIDSSPSLYSECLSKREYANFEKLKDFNFLMHPVRIMIFHILQSTEFLISSDLREFLTISWGAYTSHLKLLESRGLISYRTLYFDTNPHKVISLSDKGVHMFNQFKFVMKKVISRKYMI